MSTQWLYFPKKKEPHEQKSPKERDDFGHRIWSAAATRLQREKAHLYPFELRQRLKAKDKAMSTQWLYFPKKKSPRRNGGKN